jgi:hypothetical protein
MVSSCSDPVARMPFPSLHRPDRHYRHRRPSTLWTEVNADANSVVPRTPRTVRNRGPDYMPLAALVAAGLGSTLGATDPANTPSSRPGWPTRTWDLELPRQWESPRPNRPWALQPSDEFTRSADADHSFVPVLAERFTVVASDGVAKRSLRQDLHVQRPDRAVAESDVHDVGHTRQCEFR